MEARQAPAAAGVLVETSEFIVTAWTPGLGVDPVKDYGLEPDTAHARDCLFRWLVTDVMNKADPNLIPCLQQAGAKVFACPGRLAVMNKDRTFFEVPFLAALLVLTPWAEPGEPIH